MFQMYDKKMILFYILTNVDYITQTAVLAPAEAALLASEAQSPPGGALLPALSAPLSPVDLHPVGGALLPQDHAGQRCSYHGEV